jgi:hypothetical protein
MTEVDAGEKRFPFAQGRSELKPDQRFEAVTDANPHFLNYGTTKVRRGAMLDEQLQPGLAHVIVKVGERRAIQIAGRSVQGPRRQELGS